MNTTTTYNTLLLSTVLCCALSHNSITKAHENRYTSTRFKITKGLHITPDEQKEVLIAMLQELTDLISCSTDNRIMAEIAIGELIDKITILKIKLENIQDPAKRLNITTELDTLMETYHRCVTPSDELELLTQELMTANKALWDIEDAIREKEARKEFDDEFIKIARSVYYINDERCAAKRKINKLVGSRLNEEKAYKDYCDKNLFNC